MTPQPPRLKPHRPGHGASRGIVAPAAVALARGRRPRHRHRHQPGRAGGARRRDRGLTASPPPWSASTSRTATASTGSAALFRALGTAGRAGRGGRHPRHAVPVAHLDVKDWAKVLAVKHHRPVAADPFDGPVLARAEAAGFVPDQRRGGPAARLLGRRLRRVQAGLEALVTTYNDEVDHTPVRARLLDPAPRRPACAPRPCPARIPRPCRHR